MTRRRYNNAPGGRAVPAEKRSFSTDRELAATAGRKGGLAVRADRRSFARNPEAARIAARARWDRVIADAQASHVTEFADDSRAERHESPESYFGVSSLFRNSHR